MYYLCQVYLSAVMIFAGDGRWTPWGGWRPCSAPCGGGTQRRFRTCSSAPGGCQGAAIIGRSCNEQACEAEPTKGTFPGPSRSCLLTSNSMFYH